MLVGTGCVLPPGCIFLTDPPFLIVDDVVIPGVSETLWVCIFVSNLVSISSIQSKFDSISASFCVTLSIKSFTASTIIFILPSGACVFVKISSKLETFIVFSLVVVEEPSNGFSITVLFFSYNHFFIFPKGLFFGNLGNGII